MKKKLQKWHDSESYQAFSDSFLGLMLAGVVIQGLFFIVSALLKRALMPIHLITGALTFLLYLFFKDKAKESAQKIGLRILKFSLVLTVVTLLDTLILSGIQKVADPELAKPMVMLSFIGTIAVLIGSIVVFSKPKTKEFFQILSTNSVWDAINGGKQEEIHRGDAVLGKQIKISFKDNGDKEYTPTELPVVLPLKDRYLHMLILGPTGSGKTSQTLIPMIYSDIQNPDLGIIVMEPKGDLAEKVYAMAQIFDREVQYFNPTHPDCPYFNPLYGLEEDVIENMATTFKMLDNDSSQFFQNMNENLIRNGLKVLKRLYGNDATMLDLYDLVHNAEDRGQKMVNQLLTQGGTKEIQKENEDIASWFSSDYFTGAKASAGRGATKTYENCSGVRSQIAKLVSNKYLRRVLNPPPGHGSDVNFDYALSQGTIVTIATAQGKLRDLGRFLGYFLILQLQSSVFKRPGNEDTRGGCMLYIDEFQVYSNPGFADMLTQGRSYRVASHLATQARAQIGMGGGKDGDAFIDLVSSNARNIIVYPGGNYEDAKFYSDQFGEIMKKTKQIGVSQQRLGIGNLMEWRPQNETLREEESFDTYYSPSDIIYRPFGEITYLLIKNNSIQPAGVAKIEFIPKDVNTRIQDIVDAYNEDQKLKYDEESADALHDTPAGSKMPTMPTMPSMPSMQDKIEPSPFRPAVPATNMGGFLPEDEDDEMDDYLGTVPVKSGIVIADDDDDDELL